MRLIFICTFLHLGLGAYSQIDTRIVKEISLLGKGIKKQVMYFRDKDMIWEINYANNGWQVLDSVSYERNGLLICAKTYAAAYNELQPDKYRYSLTDTACNKIAPLPQGPLPKIADHFSLVQPYFAEISKIGLFEHAVLSKKKNNAFSIILKGQYIPSIHGAYGIPFDEQLNSCTFIMSNEKLLIQDNFYYKNFTVSRSYKYADLMLNEVVIQVKGKDSNNEYAESFRVARVE